MSSRISEESLRSMAFVAAVGAGLVPSSEPPAPPTTDQLCGCGHLAAEHKHAPVSAGVTGTICLGDVTVEQLPYPVPCACREFRRVELPLSHFRE